MYTRIIRLIPLLMCLACVLPAHASQQPNPQLVYMPDMQAVNLTLANMPSEPSHFAMSTEWDDATMYARQYHESGARLAREGFVAVSLAAFQRATHTGSGVIQIFSEVAAYSNAANARAELPRIVKRAMQTGGVTFTPLALGAVGDGSAALTASTTNKNYSLPLTEEVLFFYRGTYIAYVEMLGGSNTFSDHQLLTLTRLVDARIVSRIAHPASVLGRWNARARDFGKGFQLVSKRDTATDSTVTYRKAAGHGVATGAATIRSYRSAQAAQAAARTIIHQLRSQGYLQLNNTDTNGQLDAMMTRAITSEQVFAEDGFLVIDHYTDLDSLGGYFIAGTVGTLIDARILAYRGQ